MRYAGYQYDSETGLYYLNARYYNPDTARFLSEDTYYGNAADPLSLNLYTYCINNPIVYWDPTGHESVAVTVHLSDNTTVQATAVDGKTIMPDGSRPPVGSVVENSKGDCWEVKDINRPGESVETVPITLPDGTETKGKVENERIRRHRQIELFI